MRTRGFTLVQLLAIMAILIVLAAILFPVFAKRRDERSNCQSNLKQLMLGMLAYAQDYNDRFPPARGNGMRNNPGYGWAGSSQDYLKSIQILHCNKDSNPQQPGTGASAFSDYYYNLRLSSYSDDKLNSVANTISLGEGNDGVDVADAAYSKLSLPPNWITDTSKPTFRHLDGANYAFADGHIKWFRPTIPTTTAASSSVFTFAVK